MLLLGFFLCAANDGNNTGEELQGLRIATICCGCGAGVSDDFGGLGDGCRVEEDSFSVFGGEGGAGFGGPSLEEDGCSLGRGVDLITPGEFEVFSCGRSQQWSTTL
jgi:hypothetical protein